MQHQDTLTLPSPRHIAHDAETAEAQAFPSGWSPWGSIGKPPGVGRLRHVAAISRRDHTFDVFAVDDTGVVRWRHWYGSGWSDWFSFGGTTHDRPAAASRRVGEIDLFIRGTDNQVWAKRFNEQLGWTAGWTPMGGNIRYAPAVCSKGDGQLDLFAHAADGRLWARQRTDAQGWSAWYTPPITPANGLHRGPACAGMTVGNRHFLDVAVLDGHWKLQGYWWDSENHVWKSGWTYGRPPSAGLSWDPALARPRAITDFSHFSGVTLRPFLWGGDWQIWQWQDFNGISNVWEPIGDFFAYSAPAAVSSHPNHIGLFAIGADGSVWTALYRA